MSRIWFEKFRNLTKKLLRELLLGVHGIVKISSWLGFPRTCCGLSSIRNSSEYHMQFCRHIWHKCFQQIAETLTVALCVHNVWTHGSCWKSFQHHFLCCEMHCFTDVGSKYSAVYGLGTCINLTAKSFQLGRPLLFLGSANQWQEKQGGEKGSILVDLCIGIKFFWNPDILSGSLSLRYVRTGGRPWVEHQHPPQLHGSPF